MASLGTLVAGVAHEINNPVAATQRGAEHLREAIRRLERSQFELGRQHLSQEQVTTLQGLVQQMHERAGRPVQQLDTVARSDMEVVIEAWLKDHGSEEAWTLSPILTDMGFGPEQLSALAERFRREQLPTVVAFLCSICATHQLLEEIGQGAGRIGEIVRALKSYAYLGKAPVQEVDIHEGLDNTLVMLRSRLKAGVTVQREYAEDLPLIEAFGSELNQVWTNIIDNAVSAMDGQGEIVLRTSTDGRWVIVEIEDNGPGIPESILPNVFDPFLTTKAPGEGTGLGLNISQNIIVKKHQGQIAVSSQPGRTRFEIRLPLVLKPKSEDRS